MVSDEEQDNIEAAYAAWRQVAAAEFKEQAGIDDVPGAAPEIRTMRLRDALKERFPVRIEASQAWTALSNCGGAFRA